MAVAHRDSYVEDNGDITRNLPSLLFESALTHEEKELLVLRKRSHAITATACAQATYFVSVLNEARQVHSQLAQPVNRRASRFLQESTPRDPLLVGIIGCGRLGSHLANCLLTFGEINPEELKISTRRPETLTELQEKGVTCLSNNSRVASSVHVLFLCVLPSQVAIVAEEIKERISFRCMVYSFVSSVTIPRLKQLLNSNNIIRPEFHLNQEDDNKPWDHTLDMSGVFAIQSIVEVTCPLSFHKEDTIVRTPEKFAEAMVYAFITMGTIMRIPRPDMMDIINAVLLGESPKNPLQDKLAEEDITRQVPEDSRFFPKIDLCAILSADTPLTAKLVHNTHIRKAFVERYCQIFSQYLSWKNQALQHAKRF